MKKIVCLMLALLLAAALFAGCGAKTGENGNSEGIAEETDATETETAKKDVKKPWGDRFTCESAEPAKVAFQFMTQVFPRCWEASFSCKTGTEIRTWELGKVKRDKSSIQLTMTLAVELANPSAKDEETLKEGPVLAGTGDDAGKQITYRYCTLIRQADGSWQCFDFGDSW